jgi:hypothetical protein
MLRDNPVGLIEPMFSSAGANPLALCIAKNESSDDRPPCLENPRPEGAESTLPENAPSPFHAEPKHIAELLDRELPKIPKSQLMKTEGHFASLRRLFARIRVNL